MGKLERQHAALVKVQLVFVWLGDVQHLHIAVLHPHCEPFSGWAVAQRKDLELQQVTVTMATEDILLYLGKTVSSGDTT